MQPPTSPKPRPPAKRAPSSRRAPSAATISASPSPTPRSSNLAATPLPLLVDASPSFKHVELPDTPPLSVDWPRSSVEEREAELEREEDEHAGRDSGRSRAKSGADSAGGGSGGGSVPFPTGEAVEAHDFAPAPAREWSAPHFEQEEGASLGSSATREAPTGLYGEEVQGGEAAAQARPLLDTAMLKECSREQLEELLQHASRLFQEKEEELETFKEESNGILSKYEQLRQRHDSLLTRSTGSTIISSPPRRRVSSSSTHATVTPTTLDNPKRRSWRTSLGFPPPAAVLSSPAHHRRTSSGLSFVRSFDHNEHPSTPSSPVLTRNRNPSSATPDGSPTAVRSRFVSTSSVVSSAGPPSNLLFSPSSGAAEVAVLSQANYALTLELSELEADTERSEREGRRKLRKLEKELQALRKDLDRVEQRNAVLEDEAQAANELARSVRLSAPPPREETPEAENANAEEDNTPRFGYGEKSWREKMREELGSDAGESIDQSPERGYDPFHRAHDANDDPFTSSSSSPANVDFLSPSRRTPGQGFRHFAPSRSVSASSLVPLPDTLLSDLDPSAEAYQDLIVEQLFAEIDELSQAKELLIAERTAVELKLDEAREELVEWKERCEELEEENVQARLLGWEGPHPAIAWHSEGDADADSDSPTQAITSRSRGPRRSKERRTSRRRTITDLSRLSPSDGSSSDPSNSPATEVHTPVSSPPLVDQRTLCSELDGQWDGEVDEPDLADESNLSIVVHPLASKGSLRLSHASDSAYDLDSTGERYPLRGDDLLAAASLQHADPTIETYDHLAGSASLAPASEDDSPAGALASDEAGRSSGKRSLHLPKQSEAKDGRALRRRKEQKRSRKNKHLADFPFSDEENDKPSDLETSLSRRDLALQRLDLEASSRYDNPSNYSSASNDDDDTASVLSSNYDYLDDTRRARRLRSADYYPLTLRARYAPRMVVRMWTDSAVQHFATFATWLRFLIVLGVALVIAIYQGPKKTLGTVPARRRLR